MRRAILDIYSFSPLHRVLHSQLSGMSFKVIRGWFTTYFPHVLNHHQWEKHDLLLSPETTTRGRPHAANSVTFLCFIKNIQEPGPCLFWLPQSNCYLSPTYWLVFRGSHLSLWLGNCAAFAAGTKCLIAHDNSHKCNASKESLTHNHIVSYV